RVSNNQGARFFLAMPKTAAISGQHGQGLGYRSAVVALIGRERPLEALTALAAAVTQGRGSLAIVRGVAGIGKTRLVEELAETATGWGLDVAWSACWEGHAAPAFWPWIHLFRDLGLEDAAVRLNAGSVPGDVAEPRTARLALFDGIARDVAVA